MNEELNQKLSLYIDNELEAKELLAFKKELLQNSDLQARLKRYQLIGKGIKSASNVVSSAGFLESIKVQLEQEPIYLLPKQKTKQKYYKQLALAASIMTVAVISAYSVKFIQQGPQEIAVLQEAKNAAAKTPVDKMVADKTQPNSSSTFEYPLNKQINDYLQAHNDGLKTTPDLTYQPYTQLSSYNQR